MSCLITQTCNGWTVTLQVEVVSVRPASGEGMRVPSGMLPQAASRPMPGSGPAAGGSPPPEKGGEKESEKKGAQRKEKEKDPERESLRLAGQLRRIAEAWNSLPLKKVLRISGKRKERTEELLSMYTEEEIIRVIYSVGRSRFLLGGGARRWQIRFDWFIRPENFQKVLEGNYLDEDDGTGPGAGNGLSPAFEIRDLQAINRIWTDSSG